MTAVYKVWYARPEYARDYRFGEIEPTLRRLDTTHVPLTTVEATSLAEVFSVMQGEFWSPNGEARDLIRAKGLAHTSMNVGDVIQLGTAFYVVRPVGFTPLVSGDGEAP